MSLDGLEGSGPDNRISLWKIEQFLRDELPPDEAAAFRSELEATIEGRQYLERYESLEPCLPLRRIKGYRHDAPTLRKWFSRFVTPRWTFPIAVALSALVIGSFWYRQEPREPYRWKGDNVPAFKLRVGAEEVEPNEHTDVNSGDTLTLLYRSAGRLYCRVLFQEEGGNVEVLASQILPASTSWRTASRRVLLEGSWLKQTIWIVWSYRDIEESIARSAIGSTSNMVGIEGWEIFHLKSRSRNP